ncbi:hypothetical protein GCM10009663_76140 [Kitasatospora arboriphila]|uniref:Uncharacterized protein n=1 Tax=Kitasatospora arboriphila TaxID=258052 RepID=A0ABP4EV85_9ACTN
MGERAGRDGPDCHSVRAGATGFGDFAVLEGDEVGVGLFDGIRVRLALGVLGQRPVDTGDGGVVTLAFAGGDDQIAVFQAGCPLSDSVALTWCPGGCPGRPETKGRGGRAGRGER